MVFNRKGGTGYGSSYPGDFDDMSWYDGSPFHFKEIFWPALKQPFNLGETQYHRLEATWYYFLLFKGHQVYEFHSYYEWYIEDFSTAATNEQIKEIVLLSHEYLAKCFETRRKEHKILPAISVLSDSAIEQSTDRLLELLLDLLPSE